MSKSHRGKGIKDLVKRGRGTCPLSGTKNIKLLYEHEIDGVKVMVSKYAHAHLKNNPPPKPVVEEAPAPVAEEPVVETPAEAEAPVEETATTEAPTTEETSSEEAPAEETPAE